MKEYIYCLTLTNTGKNYVGRTSFPDRRKRQHITALLGNRHKNKRMQKDFNECPQDVSFKILCETNFERNDHPLPEQEWMERLQTYDERYGYNDMDFTALPLRRKAGLPCRKTNHCKH